MIASNKENKPPYYFSVGWFLKYSSNAFSIILLIGIIVSFECFFNCLLNSIGKVVPIRSLFFNILSPLLYYITLWLMMQSDITLCYNKYKEMINLIRKPCIYKIENLVNGKVYIGQTNRHFEDRRKNHLSKLRRNAHNNNYLQSAFNKYGDSSLKFEIIQLCDIHELDNLEIFWIELFDSQNRKVGYNLDSGGNLGKILSNETRKKISTNTKALGWTYGKHPQARKIICINNGMIFDSIIRAGEFLNIKSANVSQVVQGKSRIVIGEDGNSYQFDYYEEGKEYKLKSIDMNTVRTPKKVILVNTKEVFNSMQEASRKTGINQAKISLVCNKKRNFSGTMPNGDRMVWRFLQEYDENEDFHFIKNGRISNGKRKVKCLTTGKVFESLKEAGEFYNIKNSSNISSACSGYVKTIGRLPDGRKLEWVYAN